MPAAMILKIDLDKESTAGLKRALRLVEEALAERGEVSLKSPKKELPSAGRGRLELPEDIIEVAENTPQPPTKKSRRLDDDLQGLDEDDKPARLGSGLKVY
jgi:hypothetical protein